MPIECPPDSAPEPDAAIIRGVPRDYLHRLPASPDATCVIEAAHSSLWRDRGDKLEIYAAAGIPQYAIVNLQTTRVEVYSDPDMSSRQYQTKKTVGKGQTLALRLGDGLLEIDAAEILP